MRKPRNRKPRQKFSAFVFTNHKFESLDAELKQLIPYCVYVIAGIEVCPNTRKLHLQGYFYLKEPRTEGRARKLLKGIHIEPARDCPARNFLYCAKESNYLSAGSIISAIKSWKAPSLTC